MFIIGLFGSNMVWAADGQLDQLIDSTMYAMQDDNGEFSHHLIKDDNHEGHDCHMSAHLVGLNSQSVSLTELDSSQVLPVSDSWFIDPDIPPPSKPPRS